MPDGPTLILIGLLVALVAWALSTAHTLRRRLAAQRDELEQARHLLAEQAGELQRFERRRHELLANVSHDLRTPLASMQGYIELVLLRHGNLEAAEERNYLQTAARQGERLTRLVGDLFDLTRLEAGELVPQAEDFTPAELAQDMVQHFAGEASQRGLQLELRCADTPLRAHADLGLVARVLDGLVENALRHTPSGGRVTIDVAAQGERVCIAVRDTGSGIAADQLPGLFERYERAARVRGPGSSEHAGLGLAIAQHIVELHGSRLEVSSTEGAGTCVAFTLPQATTTIARRVTA